MIALPASAERALLSGSLGQWLSKTAAPQLAQTLSKHPKFKGEQFKFVTLANSQPSPNHNELTRAIQQELRHHILRSGNNNIAWSAQSMGCHRIPSHTYLLSVQIDALGGGRSKLTLGVIDALDGIWVSGVSLAWEGRLLNSERKALQKIVAQRTPGSIDNPLPGSASRQIAETFAKQLRCRMPGGIQGSIYITTPSEPYLQGLSSALTDALAPTPTAITEDATSATWKLSIDASDNGIGSRKLSLVMQADEVSQHVGHLFVTYTSPPSDKTNNRTGKTSAPVVTDIPNPAKSQAHQPLILGLSHKQTRQCRKRCVEVNLELSASAYVTLFRTHAGKLTPLSCKQPMTQRNAGDVRYKVQRRLPPSGQTSASAYGSVVPASSTPTARTHTGVYVLATQDPALADHLNKQFATTPGACISHTSLSDWTHQLVSLVERYPHALEWRALHFVDDESGF